MSVDGDRPDAPSGARSVLTFSRSDVIAAHCPISSASGSKAAAF
jgi:hypothetical protein